MLRVGGSLSYDAFVVIKSIVRNGQQCIVIADGGGLVVAFFFFFEVQWLLF